MSSTKGHPARFNDKTLIQFDDFVGKLKDGFYDEAFNFCLYDYNKFGDVIELEYNGCWLLVDNGYLSWSVTVPPKKGSEYRTEIRFSEWLESMRKDVECCFGILKGRWRILKNGIRLWGIDNSDKVWLTCCALHNMLLEVDGLSNQWKSGVPSNWETDPDNREDLPFALKRLATAGGKTSLDISGMGYGNDVIQHAHNTQNVNEVVTGNVHRGRGNRSNHNPSVRHLSLDFFREKLIRHFNIAFHRKEVTWPKRSNKDETKK